MSTSITTTRPPLTADAARALIIRPSDQQALAALRQLARENGAHVQRGTISLAGVRRAAWLAFSPAGRLLAAVLLDGEDGSADDDGRSSPPARIVATTHACALDAQGASSMTTEHDSSPDDSPQHEPLITHAQLAKGVLRVEAALVALEQLVAAHCDGSQPTTHDAADAAVRAFAQVHKAVSFDAARFANRLAASDKRFATTRPRAYPHATAQQIAQIVGTALLENSAAAQTMLLYLKEAAARAQVAVARLASMSAAEFAERAEV